MYDATVPSTVMRLRSRALCFWSISFTLSQVSAGSLRTHSGLSERSFSLKFGVLGHLALVKRSAYLFSYLAVPNSVCGEENETAMKNGCWLPTLFLRKSSE